MSSLNEYVIIFLQYHLSQRQAGRIPPIKRHGLISSDRYRIKYGSLGSTIVIHFSHPKMLPPWYKLAKSNQVYVTLLIFAGRASEDFSDRLKSLRNKTCTS